MRRAPDVPAARRGLLSVHETADYLGISPGTVRNWLTMRRLEHVKVGRLTRIPLAALDRYVEAHTIAVAEDEA